MTKEQVREAMDHIGYIEELDRNYYYYPDTHETPWYKPGEYKRRRQHHSDQLRKLGVIY